VGQLGGVGDSHGVWVAVLVLGGVWSPLTVVKKYAFPAGTKLDPHQWRERGRSIASRENVSRGFFFEHKNTKTKTHLSCPKKGIVPFPVLMCKISGWLAHIKNTVSSPRKRSITNKKSTYKIKTCLQINYFLFSLQPWRGAALAPTMVCGMSTPKPSA
jgi:hypothetical protein